MKKNCLTKESINTLCLAGFAIISTAYLLVLQFTIASQPAPESYNNILGVRSFEDPRFLKTSLDRDTHRLSRTSSTHLEEYISQMTLEEKVGQMFVGGAYNNERLNEQIAFIEQNHLSGIILMGSSVKDPGTTLTTTKRIRKAQERSEIPLFVAIDEEGGIVTRLGGQLSEQQSQTEIKDPISAFENGLRKGEELHKLGINTNFAPVMDYAPSPESFLYDRAFHLPKQKISEVAISMIRGYHSSDVISVPKHYPGHPDTITDSHFNIPISDVTESNFEDYASQFRLLALNNGAEMIMSGHIMFPQIDNEISSLSYELLTTKLREEYGYNGVIITDDINMGAVTKTYGTKRAAIKAIRAGNDILLYVTDTKIQNDAYQGVLEAVKGGKLSEERINESVVRILELKSDYLNWQKPSEEE